jgi:hypothetical protein
MCSAAIPLVGLITLAAAAPINSKPVEVRQNLASNLFTTVESLTRPVGDLDSFDISEVVCHQELDALNTMSDNHAQLPKALRARQDQSAPTFRVINGVVQTIPSELPKDVIGSLPNDVVESLPKELIGVLPVDVLRTLPILEIPVGSNLRDRSEEPLRADTPLRARQTASGLPNLFDLGPEISKIPFGSSAIGTEILKLGSLLSGSNLKGRSEEPLTAGHLETRQEQPPSNVPYISNLFGFVPVVTSTANEVGKAVTNIVKVPSLKERCTEPLTAGHLDARQEQPASALFKFTDAIEVTPGLASASEEVGKSVIDRLEVLGESIVKARSIEPLTAGHLEARQSDGFVGGLLGKDYLLKGIGGLAPSPGRPYGGLLGGGLGNGVGTLLDGVNQGLTGADPGVSSRDVPQVLEAEDEVRRDLGQILDNLHK